MSEEEWKDIPGFEKEYQISNLGQARSLDRKVVFHRKNGTTYERNYDGQILKSQLDGQGYFKIGLPYKKQMNIHLAVMLAFVGPKPLDQEIIHLDNNKKNSAKDNLKYASKSCHQIGDQNSRCVLTEEQVIEIRNVYDEGGSLALLTKRYKVSKGAIFGVCKNINWRHLPLSIRGGLEDESTSGSGEGV